MVSRRKFHCETLEQAIPAKNATGGEVFRGGSPEMAKLSWWR
jgi:hypothetical protein